jgi:hypothetical protein
MENAAFAFLVGSAGVVGALTILAGSLIERRAKRTPYYQRAVDCEYASGTDPKLESANPSSASQLGRYSDTHSGAKAGQSRKDRELSVTT